MANPKVVTKNESEEPTRRLAVLIDADNAQAAIIEGLLEEIASFGEATVKRIYGDFTSPRSSQWKNFLKKYAIKPVQQFAYATGKNATDSALIIDAMDLLYTRRFDGFCLVSSDSDFTGLALRIREEGLLVLGFGEKKTPDAFRNACHKFTLTEVLRPVAQQKSEHITANSEQTTSATQESALEDSPENFILNALEKTCNDSGWANLANLGNYLNKLKPDFDARLYGFKSLGAMAKAHPDLFEIQLEQSNPNSPAKVLYIRKK
ncbi:MAG: NYN domain-containing protein [Methylococcales bacterium]|nr:NYN domain-containing protein [Methylococcales bacterium]